jgi:ferrous iron transport protein B
LNTTSLDESVAVEILLNRRDPDFPDVVVVIADVENLKRNLLLFTQIKDLGLRTVLVINMSDRMKRLGIEIDVPALESSLDTRIALLSSRNDTGIEDLKAILSDYQSISDQPSLDITQVDKAYFENLKTTFPKIDAYKLWLAITQDVNFMPIEKKVIQIDLLLVPNRRLSFKKCSTERRFFATSILMARLNRVTKKIFRRQMVFKGY